MLDVLAALVAFTSADATVSSLVSGKVYALELPKAQADNMPQACVVLKPTGGLGPAGDRDYLDATEQRIDVYNYGATGIAAMAVSRATHDAFKGLNRTLQGTVLLHRAVRSGGPVWLRDPDGDWPLFLEVWSVFAAETAPT